MMDVTESSSRNVRAEVENEENRNDDNDELQKVDPPSDNDKNDSRWTLKYREPSPGLVELIEHSGVYVNAEKLAECQKGSKDCKTFAANLLTEIFNESALTMSTWFKLDEHAKNIMLQFVVQYGQIRDWMRTDYNQCILKGIRQVMLEMRRARKRKEPLNENNSQKRQFVLPPEYDKNNSRWTLKYREYALGLVELMEDSCVYVNADNLAKCKRLSNDSVTLARMLLPEIFTKSALSVCSIIGDDSTIIRPGLDENAVTSLLKLVAEYTMENDWMITDENRILNSIRQKLKVLRRIKIIEEGEEENYNEHPKKKRSEESELSNLPPEYDANDSRWTLKYREPAPGLVELMEHSGVYVNAEKLAECQKRSNDCKTFAANLLTEIFTEIALSTCLVTSSQETTSSYLNNDGINVRPKLDEHAMIILLKFVAEYGLQKDWNVTDYQSIQNSIRQKIELLRRKKYSKFTLKYREPAPGLVELMERSGVYVNAEKLTECKRLSNDCQTLARMLLTEIFTTKALGTCIFSEKNRECFNYRSLQYPAGYVSVQSRGSELDANAEIILLNFVDEYGLEKGWPVLDFQCIRNSMISKKNEVRIQYRAEANELLYT